MARGSANGRAWGSYRHVLDQALVCGAERELEITSENSYQCKIMVVILTAIKAVRAAGWERGAMAVCRKVSYGPVRLCHAASRKFAPCQNRSFPLADHTLNHYHYQFKHETGERTPR